MGEGESADDRAAAEMELVRLDAARRLEQALAGELAPEAKAPARAEPPAGWGGHAKGQPMDPDAKAKQRARESTERDAKDAAWRKEKGVPAGSLQPSPGPLLAEWATKQEADRAARREKERSEQEARIEKARAKGTTGRL